MSLDPISILIWVALGFVAGILAKFILPGRQGGGFILTTILGIAGAFLGGWLSGLVGFAPATGTFAWQSIVSAVVGALILLILFGLIFGRRA